MVKREKSETVNMARLDSDMLPEAAIQRGPSDAGSTPENAGT